jgi:hypothetical protein
MGKFTLEVDFDGSQHGHAYRAIIGKALDDARQVIRSSAQMEGDLQVPKVGIPDPVKIGSWKIEL